MYELGGVLAEIMGKYYPELVSREEIIRNVTKEEEESFLRTLETGTRLLEQYMETAKANGKKSISGRDAFILYDTYGFPFDLTQLILRENDLSADQEGFNREMEKQRTLSGNKSIQ